MTPEAARAEAESGKLRPVYLVTGEERHLASEVVSALRDAALAGGTPGLNEDNLTAGEASVELVLSAARTLPMFAKSRLVLVRSVERWDQAGGKQQKSSDALDRLADYVESPSPSTVLVLWAGKLDKRRRLYTAAKKVGALVDCDPLHPRELPGWVATQARARGNPLAPGVAELIAELCGPELSSVADALERVCLFAGDGALVTEDAVSQCIVRVRASTVWELVGAVGKRDLGAALGALDRVYDPQDRGLRLLGVLAWSTRQLLRFESATRAGLPPPEAAKRAGAPPFKARELADQTKRIARADLEGWLEKLAEVDLALKGGSKRPPRAVLEHAIIQMCEKPTPRPSRKRSNA